ncbi:ABC transporter ATP-binding protein [Congregibacter brevis]|uniref:ABC transporter ATP-binding protein n=1 Tax=Congregibacter brevis TaxID=3081201 RepID=A0ABZ0I8L3_9GAMM|nr:ABC transporter ATP-binding protein [Congregibacter sp. IMCC45268]
MADISLNDLSFRYPGATDETLANLNLEIANGEAHALLGASGAGKTTLLNILSGLLVPTTGSLCFDGEDVSELSGRRRNVAQVFQFPVLYESLSVAENLAFPLKTRKADATLISQRIDYICKELEIDDIRARKPATLSLFQKQLVAVGKALAWPDVSMVLLDEPLTAVEPRTKWRLRQTLRRVQADLKVTMIYVTHDQTEALTFADRVSILSAGGIVQTGTPQELYSSPTHEFVGHFVGSPGMNFLPAEALGISGVERAGFRPEWVAPGFLEGAEADAPGATSTGGVIAGAITGRVLRTRIQGAQQGKPFGLITLATAHGEIAIQGEIPESTLKAGDRLKVQLTRCVGYNGQRKVRDIEFL